QCRTKLAQIVNLATGVIPSDELKIWSRRLDRYLQNPQIGDTSFNQVLVPEIRPHFQWMVTQLEQKIIERHQRYSFPADNWESPFIGGSQRSGADLLTLTDEFSQE